MLQLPQAAVMQPLSTHPSPHPCMHPDAAVSHAARTPPAQGPASAVALLASQTCSQSTAQTSAGQRRASVLIRLHAKPATLAVTASPWACLACQGAAQRQGLYQTPA